jgi:hypothetical protein
MGDPGALGTVEEYRFIDWAQVSWPDLEEFGVVGELCFVLVVCSRVDDHTLVHRLFMLVGECFEEVPTQLRPLAVPRDEALANALSTV